MLKSIMKEKNMTVYQLSKSSDVPYTTVSDLVKGATDIGQCKAGTLQKIAKTLNVSMEFLLDDQNEPRADFANFKSNECHRLKSLGDKNYILDALRSDKIETYYNRKWYAECFYSLAMLDYLCRIHELPLYTKYNGLRKMKLEQPMYPSGLLMIADIRHDESIKKKAYEQSIPEFKQFNIVEGNVRDVC